MHNNICVSIMLFSCYYVLRPCTMYPSDRSVRDARAYWFSRASANILFRFNFAAGNARDFRVGPSIRIIVRRTPTDCVMHTRITYCLSRRRIFYALACSVSVYARVKINENRNGIIIHSHPGNTTRGDGHVRKNK